MVAAVQPQLPPPENNPDDIAAPEPLEFLTRDYIHPENLKLMEEDERRWRLLGRFERWQLRRYANSLARELSDAGYNEIIARRTTLWRQFVKARNEYRRTTFISPEAKQEARDRIMEIVAAAKEAKHQHDDLKETYMLFDHYQGWLDYEQAHRDELRREAKLEQKIRKQMRKEAKWLESLIIDVWRHTKGCHHIRTDSKGRERTLVPRFSRSFIAVDAHWFLLRASSRFHLPMIDFWRWRLPYGVTVDRLIEEEVIKNMKAATRREVKAVWTDQGQLMIRVSRLDSPDALPALVKWRDAMRFFPKEQRMKFPYFVGVTEGRRWLTKTLRDFPHILMGGKSQGGKSNQINAIIATIASTHSPDEVRFVIIDGKGGVEGVHWVDLPHLLWDIIKTLDEVEPVLERLVEVMRKRLDLLEQAKAKDIDAYNNRVDVDDRLARVIVVIDEMSVFVGLGRQTERIHNLIMLLTSQGRAVGVHVIAATQHPEVRVIPGRIKTNMDPRIAFAVPNMAASMVILDSPEASRLPSVAGRAVITAGLTTLTIQTPLIYDEDIAGVVGAARIAYPDVSNELRDMQGAPKLTIWDAQHVMEKCIEWLKGHLSAKELHKMLGNESPGERHLAKLGRELIDRSAAGKELKTEDGRLWQVEKVKRAYHLKEIQPA